MRFATLVTLLPLLLAFDPAQPPTLPEADRIRIAEAFRLADAIGNKVWPDWDKAPFAVLLVTKEHEFLIRHPKPSEDFKLIGDDAILKHKVWYRKRQFNPEFLATFPAVGGVFTIVIGQPENTAVRGSVHWVITMLHEHFHQLQYTKPRYQGAVDALGLAKGDQTGMWMLNYPFPYATTAVKEQYAATAQALVNAVRGRDQADFPKQVEAYLEAKNKLRVLVNEDDYKYFLFQTWQEGIARYTEIRLAELAATEYTPTKEFASLKDFHSFKEEAYISQKSTENELTMLPLDKAKRTVVYAFGAGEGLILDVLHPDWRKGYFEQMCSLDGHFRAKN